MFKKILLSLAGLILLGVLSLVLSHFITFNRPAMIFGVSFSAEHARYLGLEPRNVLETILDEWNFKYLRLTAQWDTIEKEPGNFDFGQLDWQMDMAAEGGAKVMLAVGQKTPRWPECHVPEWAAKLNDSEYFQKLNDFIKMVVQRYRDHRALEIWQVENEPFLPFGGTQCRSFTAKLLADEISSVKQLDAAHPALVSDSGELSSWRRTAQAGDLFGTTLYRVVWDKRLGYWNYDWLPPLFYRLKLWLNHLIPERAYVTELQAEPWIYNNSPDNAPLSEQYKSMDLARLKKNINYAGRVGLPRAYLWGAEWWYWLKTKSLNEIPDFVKQMKKGNN